MIYIYLLYGDTPRLYIRTKTKQLMNLFYISTISDHIKTKAQSDKNRMEGVPKLPMLKFDFKLSPDNGEFLTTIKKLVKVRTKFIYSEHLNNVTI